MNAEKQKELLDFDRKHLWHPYTSAKDPLPCTLVESAEGVYLHLADGRQVIDGMSSWWSVIHGYNHSRLNDAMRRQWEKMSHVMFGGLTHEPAITLAKQLIEITPEEIQHVFFADSGSVSVEVAMKMALQYFYAKGMPDKCKFATVRSGYHGDTWNTMSVCDPVTGMHSIFSNRLPIQYFADKPHILFQDEWNDEGIESISDIFQKYHNEIAAFIIEPIVQGTGGMRFYHPEYLKRLRQLCDTYDILFIADEIATGFGRTGTMFACEKAAITPDIMCVGKALTGGYMTLAATLTTAHVAEVISSRNPHVFMHGPTFMANPLACAVANESVALVREDAAFVKVASIEKQLARGLAEARDLEIVSDVRVMGAIGVIETKENIDLKKITPLFLKNEVWLRPFGKLIYTMPPYISSEEELSILTKGILHTLKEYATETK
ncbi:adenosylmethionine--8-amino-7-oxononanoate transaminase [Parabacteroides sp. 52]|uniref:adenosylmethionine--8-amino-7-oxononanoate transaminase n=1 Tax=unclassified Parabacteroides TaxID=2649774 RepID=UPI0013D78C54|nr:MULTISPECIES: adenosylmethionine--8-amino-7-oxononanoate transaminase [unclassified Parabacteroides]MDH6534003.1 adenosylmethionine-8-amino-7-oxononanoate aminotransferase [Parabacteroides sp. PM5-20]NDV54744.1 adenosylmethionine--8-amino-7-oxononanoate transaminase [Parabacteroides sp. 52]